MSCLELPSSFSMCNYVCMFLLQTSAKFLMGYENRCQQTTRLLQQTAEHHQLSLRTVCECTDLSSSHHPHIVEFTLKPVMGS